MTRKSDVYSFGIVVWEVTTAVSVASPANAVAIRPTTRFTPWEGLKPYEIINKVSAVLCSPGCYCRVTNALATL